MSLNMWDVPVLCKRESTRSAQEGEVSKWKVPGVWME